MVTDCKFSSDGSGVRKVARAFHVNSPEASHTLTMLGICARRGVGLPRQTPDVESETHKFWQMSACWILEI
jgi:hypothetical protein